VAGRRTNLALLLVLAVAFGSGAAAYAVGSGWGRWVAAVHGAAGLAVALLGPWKSVIVRHGLRRRREGWAASVAFLVVTIVTVAAGVSHATGVARSWGVASAMQVHVGGALIGVVLVVGHVVARPVPVRRGDFSRREALRLGVLAGGAGLTYAAVEGATRVLDLPGEDRRFTGSFERGSLVPADMPVTQWLDDDVPQIEAGEWQLVVRAGDVERSRTLDELSAYDDRIRATLDCTGGWAAEQDWSGVRVRRLLPANASGRSVVFVSATGYRRRLPLSSADHLLLATRAGGRPLSAGHGFPARLVAPGRRGFWWVKWVERIEVSETPWWWQSPFPLT
jgi:DMSO/TMAO reductase YedYZ molybdopterin-dependent catalytic subunit